MALASRTAARAPRGARPRYANVGAFLAAVAAEYESLRSSSARSPDTWRPTAPGWW